VADVSRRLALLIAVQLSTVAPASAALVPLTGDLVVNRATGISSCPDTAVGADGASLVAWNTENFQDAPGHVLVRRFEPGGARGPLRRVSVEGYVELAGIAALTDGGYLVHWYQFGPRSRRGGTAVRFLDADGEPVSSYRLLDGEERAVAAALDDKAVLVTRVGDDDLVARFLDAAGGMTAPRRLARVPAHGLADHAVAADGERTFVVAWLEVRERPGHALALAVRAQVFTDAGSAVAPPVLVDSFRGHPASLDPVDGPVVAAAPGRFVVAWSRRLPGRGLAVRAQAFTLEGRPLGAAYGTSGEPGSQHVGDVELSPDGAFVVTWEDDRLGDVMLAAVDAQGGAGPSRRLHAERRDTQVCGRLATDRRGDWAGVWFEFWGHRRRLETRRFGEERP